MRGWATCVRVGLIAISACLAGCSKETPIAPPTVPDELEALYESTHLYWQDYQAGIERIVDGDVVDGENLIAAASDRLSAAAQLCARTEGCDMGLLADVVQQAWDVSAESGDAQPGQAFALAPDSTRTSSSPTAAPVLTDEELRASIPLNGPVQAALNDWLTWNRPGLIRAYENYRYMHDKVAPAYASEGLPEALLFAIMAKETGGKVHAYSRAGAAGPMQFMPSTARRYGLGSENGFDMRLDPTASTRASAVYLKDQYQALDRSLEKTLAAYNSGESRVRRLHRKAPRTDFWDADFFYALPAETRRYVPQVLAAALLFLAPEEYGLQLGEFDGTTTGVVLREDTSLGELTICLGQHGNPSGWFRALRNLNPRARPSKRIPAGETIEMPSFLVPVYADRCTSGSELTDVARVLHDADYPEGPELVRHTVVTGESLGRISARYPCWSLGKLAAVNGIDAPDYVIRVGQQLTVPACG
jgi:membrane-bound lytic murein transglycosylase D